LNIKQSTFDMNIHIAQIIARKLRRQRAFAKLTKRSSGSKESKTGDVTDTKANDTDSKL
jgi:hypothetical protein